jgi:HAD superfamily hydrolase (TIGR01549 family)
MARLLAEAGVAPGRVAETVDWLWTEQPRRNLWRRPVPGMIELARELAAAGVPMAIFTNSEGRAAELVDEIGWSATFPILGDSGVLGIEKPEPAAFAWITDRLGVPAARVVHVGDSVGADVLGALAAGMQAIWFSVPEAGSHQVPAELPAGVPVARSAAELRSALVALGLPLIAR